MTRFAVSFSTRWSSVLAVRARFSVWPRIELASAFSRSISLDLARRELGAAFGVVLAGHEILRVRAAVLDELALVDVQHTRDRLVEELEVVTDHEQRRRGTNAGTA